MTGSTTRRTRGVFVAAAVLSMTAAMLASPALAKTAPSYTVEVVSSAADQVTGGDARLHIGVPDGDSRYKPKVFVNGVDRTKAFDWMADSTTLTGVVDGLVLGDNEVVVASRGNSKNKPADVHMTLTNHPISGPVFSGPHQYPFVCTTGSHGLGQPLVDNPSEGYPVYVLDGDGNPTAEIAGYSKDCSADTLVTHVYMSADTGNWTPYVPGDPRPADMAQTTTMDGDTVDYVVRWERGTINRFIYSIAILDPAAVSGGDEDGMPGWNGKLIYYFQGGVAIGHDQGDPSGSRMLYSDGLSQGYAVAYSTGTKTGTHYNMQLGGETALMVKERFVELYDTPVYTVSVGGSGGGIQQYLYAQNHPGLIDAAIPQYSYPDMITQAVHVGDCELLEFYMDVIDVANPRWQAWGNRSLIEGLNASDILPNAYTQAPGLSECVNGWRGLSPLTLNPMYGFVDGQELIEPQSAVAAIEWTHFGDLVNVYGVGADGYARSVWDNVGIQYGLQSVADGSITPAEFLQLNAVVGGWKAPPDMVQEGSPFFPPGVIDFSNWDPWSARNQVFSTDGTPAPRTEGNLEAMQAAYAAGLVYMGDVDIPMIDWRNYLERELDMHNSHQSFAARQRMLSADGDASNQVIWFTDVATPGGPRFDQTPEALAVIDDWMANLDANPDLGVAGNKPALAVDRCFAADGTEMYSGDDVWSGILDGGPLGSCAAAFPVYSTSRIVAGGPFQGSIFKCELKSVAQAIADGDYGAWSPGPAEQAMLGAIFPSGVCDFSQPDVGLSP